MLLVSTSLSKHLDLTDGEILLCRQTDHEVSAVDGLLAVKHPDLPWSKVPMIGQTESEVIQGYSRVPDILRLLGNAEFKQLEAVSWG